MNLNVLFALLGYYAIIIIGIFASGVVYDDAGYTTTIDLTNLNTTQTNTQEGGLFSTGVDFGRFFTLLAFGVGLPDDTPDFMKIFFMLLQTIVLIMTIAFIISSIWNG